MLLNPVPHPFHPASGPARPEAVALAVITPAYRQPGLLAEAIAAVLGQSGGPPAAAVVVDDGCPFPETAETALDLAAAHPGRVFVLRRRNGGLAAARNTGIDFALAAFPACRGLFFLDADNRLHPPFLARADAALRAAPDRVGWFYPDFDEFGGTANWTAAGGFAALPLLLQNYCEAGSLVRRAVFEAGLRFDETLRDGFEDWDFWLAAAAAGFIGQHLPEAGFRYRRRPESMLSAAERQRATLVAAIHRKHAASLRPQRLLALEAAEAPRYAVFTPDRPAVRWLLDPAGEMPAGEMPAGEMPAGEMAEAVPTGTARERFLAADAAPGACFHPPVLVFATEAALALLRRLGLIRGLFWRAEVALRGAAAVGLELRQGADDDLLVAAPAGGGLAAAAVIFVASRALAAGLAAPTPTPGLASPGPIAKIGTTAGNGDAELGAAEVTWLQALAADQPHPAMRRLRVTLPRAGLDHGGSLADPDGGWCGDPVPNPGDYSLGAASSLDPGPLDPGPAGSGLVGQGIGDQGIADAGSGAFDLGALGFGNAGPGRLLLLEAAMLRQARLRGTGRPTTWRQDFRHRRDDAAARAQALSGLGTVLPSPPIPGRRSVGFLLPVFAFGGVERVVTSQAQCLRDRGWRTHLIVLGAGSVSLPAAARAAFEDVTLVAGLGETAIDRRTHYLGAEISGFGGRPGAADALGLLAGLDVVLNTHSLGGHALMARLRACGVRTYCGLHLVERGGFGEPLGTPHTALAYEHAYDGFTVISAQLRDWCLAQGVPAAKLHLVRNAPGYPLEAARGTAIRAARGDRRDGRLRALFLGRLDAQKGLDRLTAVVARTAGQVDWRVAGRAVLAGSLDRPLGGLGVPIEPPALTAAALDALYGWADVVLLPSRFEGVPLTVLEAQRLGCAVVATNVGAVAEIVADGVDGLLVPHRLPEPAIIDGLVAALGRLDRDRGMLAAIGAAAAARLKATQWAATMRDFLGHLDAVCPVAPAG